jgi:hypothetical protein
VTISDLPRTVSLLAGEQSSPKQLTSVFNFSCFGAVVAGLAALACSATERSADAQEIGSLEARIVAVDIPGASAISQVGTFLNAVDMGACAAPIPKSFPSYIQPGAVLDPNRLLVAAVRTSGLLRRSASGLRDPSCLSIPLDRPYSRCHVNLPKVAANRLRSAVRYKCSALPALLGPTASTIGAQILLHIPA